MAFAAPIWLLGLLPWTAITLYLLWGRRKRVDVPFLDLWPASEDGVRVRRRANPPTIALLLAILAMLSAILAAGRPMLANASREPITVIVDRGWSMSSIGAIDYRAALSELGDQPLDVRTVPASAKGPTALDTRDLLHATIRRQAGPVIVYSNQAIDLHDERIVQVVPPSGTSARIILLAARETPAAQVMVRFHAAGDGVLRVSSGDTVVERAVKRSDAPGHDEFIDLPKLGQTIKAELTVNGVTSPGGVAWLVRERSWPRIEAHMPLSESLQRMVDVYARQRPPTAESDRVMIVATLDNLPEGQRAVMVPTERSVSASSTDALKVADHPITRDVKWSEVGSVELASDAPPGWTPVLSGAGKAWVAVREQPVRAVWVGFDSEDWPRSSSYVIFWANVFNWLGDGGEHHTSHPVGSLEGDWKSVELAPSPATPEELLWPGLYRRADGVLRAVRAPDIAKLAEPRASGLERIRFLNSRKTESAALSPWLTLLSLVCVCLSVVLWKRRT